MKIPKLNEYADGTWRADIKIIHKLDENQMARVVAEFVATYGIMDLDETLMPVLLTDLDEIMSKPLSPSKVMTIIKDRLYDVGTNATLFDGDEKLVAWAKVQVENAMTRRD